MPGLGRGAPGPAAAGRTASEHEPPAQARPDDRTAGREAPPGSESVAARAAALPQPVPQSPSR